MCNADAVWANLQVFKALKYMHSAELLHRDIKVSAPDPQLQSQSVHLSC